MRLLFVILIFISIISLTIGLIVFRSNYEIKGYACEFRTFDHVNFLKLVKLSKNQTTDLIAKSQEDTNDPLHNEKISYFRTKLESLERLGPLVEKQITIYGSEYSCLNEGYKLLMQHLDYPTFSAMSRKEEIELLWKKIEKKQELSIMKLLDIVLLPLVTLIVGIIGFYTGKKKKAK